MVAGVLLDDERLRQPPRPAARVAERLQAGLARRARGALPRGCRLRNPISVRVIPCTDIDRNGLHKSNLWGLRSVLPDLAPPAEACLVDGFRLGPLAPKHRAVVDGDTKSAAIAAASIIAKVTRDRLMRRLDALYPRYGFSRTSATSRPATRRPSASTARASSTGSPSTRSPMHRNPDERRAARHYRLRGYRILGRTSGRAATSST